MACGETTWNRVTGLFVVSNFGQAPVVKTFVYSTVTVWPLVQMTSKLNRPGDQVAFVSTNRLLVPALVTIENSVYVARKALVEKLALVAPAQWKKPILERYEVFGCKVLAGIVNVRAVPVSAPGKPGLGEP